MDKLHGRHSYAGLETHCLCWKIAPLSQLATKRNHKNTVGKYQAMKMKYKSGGRGFTWPISRYTGGHKISEKDVLQALGHHSVKGYFFIDVYFESRV